MALTPTQVKHWRFIPMEEILVVLPVEEVGPCPDQYFSVPSHDFPDHTQQKGSLEVKVGVKSRGD